MNLAITIHNEDLVAELQQRGEMLNAAILEAVGGLGEQLLERAQAKIAPVIRTDIGQGIYDSLTLQAAAYIDAVCQTAVFIPPSGAPSYIVAYVREFGGEKWYDIFPLATSLGFVSDAGIGAGIKSPHSSPDLAPFQESRLPHTLAWSEGGGTVFAAHVWHPPAKERSYLRSSLEEMQGEIRDVLTTTIAEVLAA